MPWCMGVGSAGTFTGIARFLKKHAAEVLTVAVETAGQCACRAAQPGPHRVEGIGVSFIPATFDRSVCDRVMRVMDDEAFAMVQRMAARRRRAGRVQRGRERVCRGGDRQRAGRGKRVVTIVPDSAERYFSKAFLG